MSSGVVVGGLNGTRDMIRSIQRGTVDMGNSKTKDIIISSVNVSGSIIRITSNPYNANAGQLLFTGEIVNPTTIRIMRGTTDPTSVIVEWEVVEFNSVKSKQTGSLVTTSTEETVTITSINKDKSLLFASALSTTNGTSASNALLRKSLSSNTSLYFNHDLGVTGTIKWQVVEFY